MVKTSQDETCPECSLTPIRGIKEFGRAPTYLTEAIFDCPSCGLFEPASPFRLRSEICLSHSAQVREILKDAADQGEPGGGGGSCGKSKPKPKPARGAAIYEDDPGRWNSNSAAGIAAIRITRISTKTKSTSVFLPLDIKRDLEYLAKARGCSVASLLETAIADHGLNQDPKPIKRGENVEFRMLLNEERKEVLQARAKALKMTLSGFVSACAQKFLEKMPEYS